MTDFFIRMAQRTRGTAQTVQPLRLPRFAAEPYPLEVSPSESLSDNIQSPDNHHYTVNLTASDPEGLKTAHKIKQDLLQEPRITDPLPKNPSSPIEGFYPSESPADSEAPHNPAKQKKEPLHQHSPGDLAPPRGKQPDEQPLETARVITPADIERPSYDNETLAPDNKKLHRNRPLVQGTPLGIDEAITSDIKPATPPDNHRFSGERYPNSAFDIESIEANDSSAEQIIKVTIGRIDVRAVHTPPPVAPKKAPYRPHLSLDDYLQQRRRGER